MISLGARLVNAFVRLYTYKYRKNHMSLSRSVKFKDSPYKPPKGLTHAVRTFNGVQVEILSPIDAKAAGAILHFHGGGYTVGMNDFYRKIAARYARLTGCAVYSIDYAPGQELRHPALLDACYNACVGLADGGVDIGDIVAVGDSMGANLALTTCLKLRDAGRRLPRAIVSVSVGADFSLGGDSYRTNCHADPMYSLPRYESYEGHEHHIRRKSPYVGGADPRDPYLSPAFADLTGFPPLLIQYGGSETSASDNEMVYARAQAAHVDATLTAYAGMFHDFQYLVPFIRESRAAWREIKAFIEKYIR